MRIGKFRHKISVANEFAKLSKSDELVASLLAEKGEYRQACYFIIQAMEKSIRAKIFDLVNPNIEYFREKNRSHSLDSAVNFLLEIVGADKTTQQQVSTQLNSYVLGNIKYNHLHNNLRYPMYSKRYDSYSMLDIDKHDFDLLQRRLDSLNDYLKDLARLRNA